MGYGKAPDMYHKMEEGDEDKNRLGCLAITFVNEDAASPEDPETFLNISGQGTEDMPYWMPKYVKIKVEETLRDRMPLSSARIPSTRTSPTRSRFPQITPSGRTT